MFVDCPFSFLQLPLVSHLQVYRHYHERSLTIIGRSFHRQTWWYIGHLLMVTFQGSSSNIPSFTWFFSSPHKTVFRNFLSTIRTHLIRSSDDSSSMFVVFGFDLIFKVWFVWIGLDLVFGFSWRCSWSFVVVSTYLSLCICHLPNRHMMSTYGWGSSVFIFIIVWTWNFYSLTFALFYSDENKHTLLWRLSEISFQFISRELKWNEVKWNEISEISWNFNVTRHNNPTNNLLSCVQN